MPESCVDGVGLAQRIHQGELSVREAVEHAIRRIESTNDSINAVVHTRFEEALDDVARGLPNGPLHGVPMLVKDLDVHVAGLPATSGSRLFADHRPGADSDLVERYRRCGMVVLGSTNVPEFGRNATTEPVLFGATRNPVRHTHSCGGSSGGSAAAVAAGMVPVAHGSDGAGSIRIPSAMCGLFGLKPSRGRVPAGAYPASLSDPLPVHHALTTTVRDSAALLDAVTGPVAGGTHPLGPPARPYAEETTIPPGKLRIACTTKAPDGSEVDPGCVAAVERMARASADLGHEVVEAAPSYSVDAANQASRTIMSANLARKVEARLEALGRELAEDDVEPFTHIMLERARSMRAGAFLDALRTAEETARHVERFFADYDVLLTPTTGAEVPELGVLDTTDPAAMYRLAQRFAAFTSVFNVTGHPAMSIPSGVDDTGMPVGAHFVGCSGAESLLLRLAGQLERAVPWPLPACEFEKESQR